MNTDRRNTDREAADWFLLLHEEPDDAALRARFAAWRGADARHAEAWRRISQAGDALAAAPSTLWDEALPPRRRHRRPVFRPLAAAAMAACIALLLVPSLGLHLRADHVTGTGVTGTVRLDDGSTVELGPDSAVAVDYGGGSRRVRLLAGQAWFEVAPDAARPFTVEAGSVTATVLGTAFDVKRLAGSTDVSVEHGRVRVSDKGGPASLSRELTAGEWVRIGEDHGLEAGVNRPDMIGQWRRGHLLVQNRTIADVIEEIRPWRAGWIVLADSDFGRRRVTGFYDLRDPDVTLASLVHPGGGRVVRVTPWLTIVRGP